jgi:glyoxylase-like metal-dependent hydrolase (beta-lactamase superfamily II)
MALAIVSGGDLVLHLADTALHPLLMEHPEWSPRLHLLPEQAIATRRRLLDRAATERARVFAFHFPFPGLGVVVPRGAGWRWQPIEPTM